MDKNVKQMFSDCNYFLKKFNDEDYKYNMKLFREKWNKTFVETIVLRNYEADSLSFVSQVKTLYTRFGKVNKSRKQDLSLFMIYFVFPAILLTDEAEAKELCDVLLMTWNKEMGTDISYTNYDDILANFNDRMFGMF